MDRLIESASLVARRVEDGYEAEVVVVHPSPRRAIDVTRPLHLDRYARARHGVYGAAAASGSYLLTSRLGGVRQARGRPAKLRRCRPRRSPISTSRFREGCRKLPGRSQKNGRGPSSVHLSVPKEEPRRGQRNQAWASSLEARAPARARTRRTVLRGRRQRDLVRQQAARGAADLQ